MGFIANVFGAKNNAPADAYQVDPNAYQYGGQAGGAAAASNAALAQQGYQGQRTAAADAMAGGQGAASQDTYNVGQVGTGYATGALDQSQGARGAQQSALAMAYQRAQGQNLISNQVAAAQSQQLAAQQASAAASARGPAALALAQQNAAGNTATGQAAIAQGAGTNAANEQLANEQAFGNMATTMRQGDLATAGAGTQLAQTGYGASQGYAQNAIGAMNAGTQAGQLGLGYGELANQINTAQLSAQGNEQAQKSSNQAGAQALNAQIQGQNASTNLSLGMGVVGAATGGVGTAAGGLGGGGGGGKAKGGAIGDSPKPYLVGEEGPELVVPRKPGYVMTAHQTAALMGGGGPTPQQQSYLAKAWHAQAREEGGEVKSRPAEDMTMGRAARADEPRRDPAQERAYRAGREEAERNVHAVAGSVLGQALGPAGIPTMVAGEQAARAVQASPPMAASAPPPPPAPAPSGYGLSSMLAPWWQRYFASRGQARDEGGAIAPSTWGTGQGTDPEALEGQRWARAQDRQAVIAANQPDMDRANMAGQGMMTGLGMAGAYGAPGLNQAQGLQGVYGGLGQAGVDVKPSAEARKSDQAAKATDKGESKTPAWWQQGLSDTSKGLSTQAARVDTGFHGGGGYVPPNLIPLRAFGGPMGGDLGASMGQGVNPYAGSSQQISHWANFDRTHPGALDSRAGGGPLTSYEEELRKRCSGGLMRAYGKGR